MPRSPALIEGGFDAFAEASCRPYYAQDGRALGATSWTGDRQTAEWRCSDSLSLPARHIPCAVEDPRRSRRAPRPAPAVACISTRSLLSGVEMALGNMRTEIERDMKLMGVTKVYRSPATTSLLMRQLSRENLRYR